MKIFKNILIEKDGVYQNYQQIGLDNLGATLDTFDIDAFSFGDLIDYFDFLEFDKYEFIVFGDGSRLEALLETFVHDKRISVTSLNRTEKYENDAIKNGKVLARLGIYPKGLPKSLIKHVFLSTNPLNIKENLDASVLESLGVNHGIYVHNADDYLYEAWMNIVEFGEFPIANKSAMDKLVTELDSFKESGQLSWGDTNLPVDLGYITETNGLHRLLIDDEGISFSFLQKQQHKLAMNTPLSTVTIEFTAEIDELRKGVLIPYGLEDFLPLLLSIASSKNGSAVSFYTKFNGKAGNALYNFDIDNWIGYQLDDVYYVIQIKSLRTFEVNERFMHVFHQIQLNIPSNDADEVIGILKEND